MNKNVCGVCYDGVFVFVFVCDVCVYACMILYVVWCVCVCVCSLCGWVDRGIYSNGVW